MQAIDLNPQLLSLFWELNYRHFQGLLPLIDVRFSGRLKTTGGQYFRKPARLIQISTRYLQMDDPWKEISDTLGHELVHYWLDLQGKPCGHTPEFRKKMRECGFQRYSRLAPTLTMYLYKCPSCLIPYYRRRRGTWSCGPCSGRKFDSRYILQFQGRVAHTNVR